MGNSKKNDENVSHQSKTGEDVPPTVQLKIRPIVTYFRLYDPTCCSDDETNETKLKEKSRSLVSVSPVIMYSPSNDHKKDHSDKHCLEDCGIVKKEEVEDDDCEHDKCERDDRQSVESLLFEGQ